MGYSQTAEPTGVIVIAEAGVNHNGDPALAFELARAARAAGADCVKYQAFRAASLAGTAAPKAEYQKQVTSSQESQLEMLSRLELGPGTMHDLAAYCKELGIGFLATPFDRDSIRLLHAIGVLSIKIPSGEITNLPYLRELGALRLDLFVSTGMSTLGEVAAALSVLEISGTPRSNITLLHCTTEYPAPFDEINLSAMETMRKAFPGLKGVGYSDHSVGIAVPIAAAALGATVIEKHFTLDRTMPGPDHKASVEPGELSCMIEAIRQVERALGDGRKVPTPSEQKNISVVRKSIVAATAIRQGDVFSEANLTTKRPGTGVSPMIWDALLGHRSDRDYAPDEAILFKLMR